MVDSGVHQFNCVEVHGRATYHPHEILGRWTDRARPYVLVRGYTFTRVIQHQMGRVQTLLQQTIEPNVLYEHGIYLPLEATMNRESLRQAIHDRPPPVAEDQAPDPDGWFLVAERLSRFAEFRGVFHFDGAPFAIVGDETFGRVTHLYNSNGWAAGIWDPDNPIVPVDLTSSSCSICEVDLPNDHNHEYINRVIGFPCGHAYHKICVYPYMWRNSVGNNNHALCLECDARLC